ncbi:hypothetical protein UFOVP833_57 [uncultured Caudovirales phage]|uniref:Uncharacterized protein n=1 Tax=uncultured Caudovirales phage TaxID=2100421 RepID=A0A6J5SSJ5_9CAUD|nr:hypothetical protein UFOVP833_57 [uncultured Caudovirales phage]CAB4218413.1 hypothetical protein UFOVP1603_31 [uncultured Caudovirales phage]
MADWREALAEALMRKPPAGYTPETAPKALSPLYQGLAPAPNTEYGTVLPVARDTQTGERRMAMPSIFREGLGGVLDLLAGTETGQVTPRAAETLALGGLGTGAALAERGALASGGAPIRAYHASPHSFDRFDARKIGTGEGTQMEGKGLYFSGIQEGAEGYRKPYMLGRPDVPTGTRHPGQGHMYEVDLHVDPKKMLDLGTEQGRSTYHGFIDDYVRKNLPGNIESMAPAEVGKLLKQLEMDGARALGQSGVPGATYQPGTAAFEKTGPYSNYVMFPGTEESIEILRKYGMAAPVPLAAPSASPSEQRRSIFDKVY